jgi:hypothetical protein
VARAALGGARDALDRPAATGARQRPRGLILIEGGQALSHSTDAACLWCDPREAGDLPITQGGTRCSKAERRLSRNPQRENCKAKEI